MQLFYAPQSPFARKARLVIRELGLTGIDEIAVNPFDVPAELVAVNPLSKVPALILDDGTALYDSQVICEYLGSMSGGSVILPATGSERWQVLRRHALADGVLDQAFNTACEINRRPEHERSPDWIKRWCAAIERGLGILDAEINTWGREVTLAHIGAACMLSYLDLRLSALVDWRSRYGNLVRWHAAFAERPSMQATVPPSAGMMPVR
jgi:glutathione S-transferase